MTRSTADVAGADELWGFCDLCSRWRRSANWFEPGAAGPVCPTCGAAPSVLEVYEDGVGRVRLVLQLPPGAEIPVLT